MDLPHLLRLSFYLHLDGMCLTLRHTPSQQVLLSWSVLFKDDDKDDDDGEAMATATATTTTMMMMMMMMMPTTFKLINIFHTIVNMNSDDGDDDDDDDDSGDADDGDDLARM